MFMPKISQKTLQKRYGGLWVALSYGEGKVYAARKEFGKLVKALEKKEIAPKKVVFVKVGKPGSVSVY